MDNQNNNHNNNNQSEIYSENYQLESSRSNIDEINSQQLEELINRESFLQQMQNSLAPNLKLKSSTTIFTIIMIINHIIATILFGIDRKSTSFLQVTREGLQKMGEKSTFDIKYNLQIYRLITSLFLHHNFLHLVGNIALLCVLGSFYEHKIGSIKFITVFLINGVSANIFTCILSNSSSIGASVSLIGIWGAIISLIIQEAQYHSQHTTRRQILGIALILYFASIISIFSGIIYSSLDNLGHFAGFISGNIMGFIFIIQRQNQSSQSSIKILQYTGAAFIIFYLHIGLFYIFYISQPKYGYIKDDAQQLI